MLCGDFEEWPRNKKIVMMAKWGIKKTLIAEHFGITKQRVNDILPAKLKDPKRTKPKK